MGPALRFGLEFADLYDRDGLIRIDRAFIDDLGEADAELQVRLLAARADPAATARKAEGDLLLALAPHVDDFLAKLFAIEPEVATLRAAHYALAPLYAVKRLFVQRRAVKGAAADGAATADGRVLAAELRALGADPDDELAFARVVEGWLADESAHANALALAARYAAWAVLTPAGAERHHAGILFKVPHRVDPQHLVPVEAIEVDGVRMLRFPPERWRHREGFALTDRGTDLAGALDQANYCIWCQHQGKDSCSTGLRDRRTGEFQRTVFGVPLAGCPLDEKISEMNEAKAGGHALAALAIVAVDNPLCAATGHRICNDCMKACIYQKQEPVDIPQVETRTLKDVLELPWGFEIYGLLTRWNPLDIRRPLPRPDTGRTVLVVGLGPAGFNLSHHLMNDGHRVVAIDGLKIE
ncbi:MAG: pyridine nucleotide-disulfide oxidoreductase, partial [Alphaproteobacteria bacterium]